VQFRLLNVVTARESAEEVAELLSDRGILALWDEEISDGRTLTHVLLRLSDCEGVLDELSEHFEGQEQFRVVLLAVEATVPRPEEPEQEQQQNQSDDGESESNNNAGEARISREELYSDIAEGAEFSLVSLVMVVLSTVVAAIGLLNDDVAAIIGAMVIAPLLGPNMALALATTLGDLRLAWRALLNGLAGLFVALVLSISIGLVWHADTEAAQITLRTHVGLPGVVLALASGTAGALAFTRGMATVLVGVMVAVALLPPLVTLGLMTGAGEYMLAGRALLLLATNVICVNLAGVATFIARGIRPRTWYESDRAKRATRVALALWTTLLLALLAVIVLWTKS